MESNLHKSESQRQNLRNRSTVRNAYYLNPSARTSGLTGSMRVGKTARDNATGAHSATAKNKADRASANRERKVNAGKKRH